jgi:hypothetical protein
MTDQWGSNRLEGWPSLVKAGGPPVHAGRARRHPPASLATTRAPREPHPLPQLLARS